MRRLCGVRAIPTCASSARAYQPPNHPRAPDAGVPLHGTRLRAAEPAPALEAMVDASARYLRDFLWLVPSAQPRLTRSAPT